MSDPAVFVIAIGCLSAMNVLAGLWNLSMDPEVDAARIVRFCTLVTDLAVGAWALSIYARGIT